MPAKAPATTPSPVRRECRAARKPLTEYPTSGTTIEATRSGTVTGPTGKDARNALAIALAGIQSVSEGRTFKLAHV